MAFSLYSQALQPGHLLDRCFSRNIASYLVLQRVEGQWTGQHRKLDGQTPCPHKEVQKRKNADKKPKIFPKTKKFSKCLAISFPVAFLVKGVVESTRSFVCLTVKRRKNHRRN